jgi:protein-tyrosine phosphatase
VAVDPPAAAHGEPAPDAPLPGAPGILNMRPVIAGLVYSSSAAFGWDAVRISAFLARYGIESVVDLRSAGESTLVPWNFLESGAGLPELVPAPLDPSDGNPNVQHRIDTVEDLAELYLWWTQARPEMVARALSPIAAGHRTLLQCSAGKDRTGVLSAVVHLAAGTAREEIVRDYARTEAELPAILAALRGIYLRMYPERAAEAFDAAALPVILTSPARAMELFLERFLARHGSVENYLHDAGMRAVAIDALHAELCRPHRRPADQVPSTPAESPRKGNHVL